jgi:hypothetical protein
MLSLTELIKAKPSSVRRNTPARPHTPLEKSGTSPEDCARNYDAASSAEAEIFQRMRLSFKPRRASLLNFIPRQRRFNPPPVRTLTVAVGTDNVALGYLTQDCGLGCALDFV